MRTTSTQDREFINQVISTSLLEKAIDFIKSNFDAVDLYGEEHMRLWAEENGYTNED